MQINLVELDFLLPLSLPFFTHPNPPQTFFKVFFSIVVFGLFHALVFFPVILSYIGPAAHELTPRSTAAAQQKNINEEKADTNVENTIHSIDNDNKTNKIGVQYKTPKNFVSISEFRALPTHRF